MGIWRYIVYRSSYQRTIFKAATSATKRWTSHDVALHAVRSFKRKVLSLRVILGLVALRWNNWPTSQLRLWLINVKSITYIIILYIIIYIGTTNWPTDFICDPGSNAQDDMTAVIISSLPGRLVMTLETLFCFKYLLRVANLGQTPTHSYSLSGRQGTGDPWKNHRFKSDGR
jgi:hypothetical protein